MGGTGEEGKERGEEEDQEEEDQEEAAGEAGEEEGEEEWEEKEEREGERKRREAGERKKMGEREGSRRSPLGVAKGPGLRGQSALPSMKRDGWSCGAGNDTPGRWHRGRDQPGADNLEASGNNRNEAAPRLCADSE